MLTGWTTYVGKYVARPATSFVVEYSRPTGREFVRNGVIKLDDGFGGRFVRGIAGIQRGVSLVPHEDHEELLPVTPAEAVAAGDLARLDSEVSHGRLYRCDRRA